MVMSSRYSNTDEYISSFPELSDKLEQMRAIIKQAAPNAKEVISYNMPAIRQHGILVYYAANKNHIGLYPTASGISVFQEELSDYKTSKGAIQFPHNKPLPVNLIKRIVKYRAQEDREKAEAKKK